MYDRIIIILKKLQLNTIVWGLLTFAPIKINNVYGNLKDWKKLDLCICEALSYTHATMENILVGIAINYHLYQLS